MVVRRRLLTVLIAAGLILGTTDPVAAAGLRDEAPSAQSDNDGNAVSIRGEFINSGGSGEEPPASGAEDTPADPADPVDPETTPGQQTDDSATTNRRHHYRCTIGVNCTTPTSPSTPGATAAPAPTVTIRDLATFLPASTTLTMEPAHWMLRDRPTNFIAHAQEHTVTGTLLGQQADVRFTPTNYTFDYGDGTTTTTETGGATWKELNLPEFSTTKTSHTYTQRGNHTITASANYVAAYRLNGGPWTAVTGTLTSPTTHTGRTLTINTVLVRGTCTDYPTDPGCPDWNPDQ
ncbi:hypothetical protein HQQ80_11665 [Microbacteriaceae bacterium VKM Ac-2855]|nr:hypothetical protein [Microbacteriaceae bacterium VKM Ac-2855]